MDHISRTECNSHTYAVLFVLSLFAIGFPVTDERSVEAEVELEVAVDESGIVATEW